MGPAPLKFVIVDASAIPMEIRKGGVKLTLNCLREARNHIQPDLNSPWMKSGIPVKRAGIRIESRLYPRDVNLSHLNDDTARTLASRRIKSKLRPTASRAAILADVRNSALLFRCVFRLTRPGHPGRSIGPYDAPASRGSAMALRAVTTSAPSPSRLAPNRLESFRTRDIFGRHNGLSNT